MSEEELIEQLENISLEEANIRADILLEQQDYIEEKDKEIERLNNIINTILEFDFFKSNCPLDFSYTEKCNEDAAQNVFYEDAYCEENCSDEFKKCWLKYFEKLQELKGDSSNE